MGTFDVSSTSFTQETYTRILLFYLSLLRGPCARVRRKTEDINSVYVILLHKWNRFGACVTAPTWFKAEFWVVTGNKDACW